MKTFKKILALGLFAFIGVGIVGGLETNNESTQVLAASSRDVQNVLAKMGDDVFYNGDGVRCELAHSEGDKILYFFNGDDFLFKNNDLPKVMSFVYDSYKKNTYCDLYEINFNFNN